jgi:hypothetical protein
MEAMKRAVSALLVIAVGGCRAQPAAQGDFATPPDLAGADFTAAGADLSSGVDAPPPEPDLSCPVLAYEICGNGCDDDRNGYTDDDDPACTPQVVATFQGGSSELDRLVLTPLPRRGFLDGNPVLSSAHATYSAAFARGVAFLALDGGSHQLQRLTLPPTGMGAGMLTTQVLGFSTRDACVFDGELIVVDAAGYLHRLSADGVTVLGTVPVPSPSPGSMLLSACASDGNNLYVAEHDLAGHQTQFEVLAKKTFLAQAVPAIKSPKQLNDLGFDRCLDFAWTSRGFYGLFVQSGGVLNDSALVATQVTPFALDGGVGPAVDAGTLHGIGEFLP